MPIGDLLAEISGGDTSSAPPLKTPTTGTKRKAEEDSQNVTSVKLTKSRQQDGSYSTTRITRDVKRDSVERSKTTTSYSTTASSLPHRPTPPATNGRYQPPVPNGQRMATTGTSSNGTPSARPLTNAPQSKQSSSLAPRPKLSSASLAAASRVPPAKPSPTTPTLSDPSKAHKKGSYQEIMERAKKAQATMGKVGMIQHKAMDKKERPVKTEQKPGVTKGKDGKPYSGNGRTSGTSSRTPARPGMVGREASRFGARKDAKSGVKSRPGSSGSEVPEKKLKKSATATTGYTGTARPRPGAASGRSSSSRKGHSSSYKSGGLLAPPKPSRRDRDQYEDEYDDDMDDFIDYDDDEDVDPRGGGYGYDSDASSDMEAGLTDIDVEERRAEKMAVEEDKREKALEDRLKREKEERRRRLAQGR
ncbi:hypothetical protein GGR54DRAFT_609493 [Hypoxylon sp. NC1633]|nr:hypothetical protein GGR54DRAFT_609493 [Hypoxylon sp. NC1633]